MGHGDWVALSQESIFRGRDRFGDSTIERCANLALYIGHNKLISEWTASPASLLDEITGAAAQLEANLDCITDPQQWKLGRLVIKDADGSPMGLRKPAINVRVHETTKGNLRLDWYPKYDDEDECDFKYRTWDFSRRAGYQDLSELLFIRRFDTMRGPVGREREGRMGIDIRPMLADIAIGLVEETIERLKKAFEVDLHSCFALEYDSDHQLKSVEIIGKREAEARAHSKREADAAEKAARLRDELALWAETYQIEPQIAANAWKQMSERRMPISDRIDMLRDRLGAVIFDNRIFEKDLKRVLSVMRELGFEPTATEESVPESARTAKTSAPRAATANALPKSIIDRIQDSAGSLRTPPAYPARTYDPGDDELSALGVGDVRQMVDLINSRLADEQKFPITVGDFPTNKAKFEKLAKMWRAMNAIPDPEASISNPTP